MTNNTANDEQWLDEVLEELGESYYPEHEYNDMWRESNAELRTEAKAAILDRFSQREVVNESFTAKEVEANKSIGWFSHGEIIFQIIEVGKSARIVGALKASEETIP